MLDHDNELAKPELLFVLVFHQVCVCVCVYESMYELVSDSLKLLVTPWNPKHTFSFLFLFTIFWILLDTVIDVLRSLDRRDDRNSASWNLLLRFVI